MKSRKHKIAKKREQGRRNHQRKLDHERKLQQQLGTEFFGYWEFPVYGDSAEDIHRRSKYFGEWQSHGAPIVNDEERMFFVQVTIKDDIAGRTYVTDMQVGPCGFMDIYGAVVANLDEIHDENRDIKPNAYNSYARVRT